MDKVLINIDIETIPPGDRETFIFEKSPPKNIKDPEKIEKWNLENKEKAFRDQAKKPESAQILVIGAIIENESDCENDLVEPEPLAFYGEDEEKVLRSFQDKLRSALVDIFEEDEEREVMRDYQWVGYNVRKFDLEAIFLKAVKYKLYFLANLINRNRFSRDVYDLMEKIQGPRTQDYISFDKALRMFDIGQKTEGIDGSQVFDYYEAGKLESDIVPYCIDDIMSNRKLYKRLKKCISE